MPVCNKCGNFFPNWVKINGERKSLKNRKYCLDCSPYGLHNTIQIEKKKLEVKRFCKQCGKELNCSQKVYCSFKCQQEFQYQDYIDKWKRHEVDGSKGKSGQLSKYVRKYIFSKYDSKCVKCGWSEINPYTKTIPLEVEHIDGNWKNSYEDNLTLLCPNCHSLTSTYRGANRGHGRDITWILKDKNTTGDNN
jgi:hypothetical protein